METNSLFEPILDRKRDLEVALAIERDPKAAHMIHIRWLEICNVLNLLGYEEPEPTDEELDDLINILED